MVASNASSSKLEILDTIAVGDAAAQSGGSTWVKFRFSIDGAGPEFWAQIDRATESATPNSMCAINSVTGGPCELADELDPMNDASGYASVWSRIFPDSMADGPVFGRSGARPPLTSTMGSRWSSA